MMYFTSYYRGIKVLKESPLFFRGAISFFDQGLLSAANFAVGIVLIKTVPQEHYGYWAIARIIFIFLVSIQNAVITTPLNVLLASKTANEKNQYVKGLFRGQLLFLLPLNFVAIAVLYGLYLQEINYVMLSIIGYFCLSSIFMLLKEFMRGYYFAIESVPAVLRLDLIYLFFYLSSLSIVCLVSEMSVAINFVLMGFSCALVLLIIRKQIPYNCGRSLVKQSYQENWRYGKWALMGVFVNHINHRGYLYLLGFSMGGVAVAHIAASQLFFMPFNLLQGAWGKVALPNGSKLRASNKMRQFFKQQVAVTLMMAFVIAVYSFILIKLSPFLLEFLLTDEYEKSFEYIVLLAFIAAMSAAVANASCGLQVALQFQQLTTIHFVVMIITIISCLFLMDSFGAKGALASVLIGHTLFATILWKRFYSESFSSKPATLNNQEKVHLGV